MESTKPPESYKRIKQLGAGLNGTAYLMECQSDKSFAVIKQIEINNMSDEERREALREAKILEVLKHDNIIEFKEVYKTKKGKLCIVMGYADDGDLAIKIQEQRALTDKDGNKTYFTEEQVLKWFSQVALALKYIHDRKILHRDLKPGNVFLCKDGHAYLGDFGIARVLSSTQSKAYTLMGTPYYLSPEIVQEVPYGFKTDIWSLGILLYEMCALEPPFNGKTLTRLTERIVKGRYPNIPDHFSKNLKNLIKSMLNTNVKDRANVNQICRFPIIEKCIKSFTTEEAFEEQFSHTIKHESNIFSEFLANKNQIMKGNDEDDRDVDHDDAQEKLSQLPNDVVQACGTTVQFTAQMNKMYGEQSFKKGFEIFMSNRQILKEEDGEDKMADLLNHRTKNWLTTSW